MLQFKYSRNEFHRNVVRDALFGEPVVHSCALVRAMWIPLAVRACLQANLESSMNP